MRFDAVINRFAFEANYLNRISIEGSGKQSRAFVHIDAITKVLTDLLNSKVPSGTYNLALKNYSVLDLVDVFKELIPELEFIFVDQHQIEVLLIYKIAYMHFELLQQFYLLQRQFHVIFHDHHLTNRL